MAQGKNKLISIGWIGTKQVYLNVSREEAIARYVAMGNDIKDVVIEEFIIEDEFWAYDIGN